MLLGLISRLPLPALYAFFGCVAWLLRVLRWRRHLVDGCLRRCFPERGEAERRRLAGDFYAALGRVAAETLRGTRIAPADLDARVRFENPGVVLDALTAGRRVLLLAAHHCNWEWLLLACSRQFGEPLVAPYKPLSVATVDRWIREMRSRFGATMVPAQGLVAHLLARRGQVRLLAMLADQSPRCESEHQRWLPFFGEATSFFRGPGQISARMGFDPVFVAMSPAGRGRYAVRFVPLTQGDERLDAEQVLCAYVRALEQQILEYPAQYFWAYNRWKRSKSLYE